jgi:hypothetical protein
VRDCNLPVTEYPKKCSARFQKTLLNRPNASEAAAAPTWGQPLDGLFSCLLMAMSQDYAGLHFQRNVL